jgi:hypothetical protein
MESVTTLVTSCVFVGLELARPWYFCLGSKVVAFQPATVEYEDAPNGFCGRKPFSLDPGLLHDVLRSHKPIDGCCPQQGKLGVSRSPMYHPTIEAMT